MKSLGLLILSSLFLSVGTLAVTHPHIWIDNQIEIRVNGDRVEAIRAQWTFDPFFSQQILVDIGRPRGGSLSSAEVEMVRRNAFENLRNFGYFTYIRINGQDHPVRNVEGFDAHVNDDNSLVYAFDIPLNVQVGSDPLSIRVSMYDESFFTDFAYDPRQARVNGAGALSHEQNYTREQHMVPIWGPMQRETIEVVFHPN